MSLNASLIDRKVIVFAREEKKKKKEGESRERKETSSKTNVQSPSSLPPPEAPNSKCPLPSKQVPSLFGALVQDSQQTPP
jgi:hypothetical protein